MAILHSVLHHQDVEESEEEEVAEEADDAQTKSKKKNLNKAERLGMACNNNEIGTRHLQVALLGNLFFPTGNLECDRCYFFKRMIWGSTLKNDETRGNEVCCRCQAA